MIAEAIDTAYTLGWALLGWLIFFATIGSVLVLAAVATGVWGAGVAWRTLRAVWARARGCAPAGAPNSPSRLPRSLRGAPEASRAPSRPAPSWARAEHDHQEAA